MAYNYEFPYTDPNRYNDDWVLKKVKDMGERLGKFTVENTPIYGGIWSANKEYKKMTYVYDSTSGNTYLSLKDVPFGAPLSDNLYWQKVGDFNAQYAHYANKVNALIDTSLLAGKKIAVFGDSISDYTVNAPNWVRKFQDITDGICEVVNYSQSGRRLIELPAVLSIMDNSLFDFDIAIIFLGTNDWYTQTPLGTYNGSAPNTNFTDAIISTYNSINDKCNLNGKTPLFYFITPLYRSNLADGILSIDCYRQAIISFCKKYGCNYINGNNFPRLSPNGYDINKYQPDGLHPTTAYSDIMSRYILAKLCAGGEDDKKETTYHNFNDKTTESLASIIRYYMDGNILKLEVFGNVTFSSAMIALNANASELFTARGAVNQIATVFSGAINSTALAFLDNGIIRINASNVPGIAGQTVTLGLNMSIAPAWCNF